MKIRKGLKRTLAAALAVMLMGGMTDMSAFAQEVEETGTEPPAVSKESGEQVTGARETLNCVEAAKNMSLEFFNEVEGAGNWAERMALPDYAAGLYNTLASGFDSAFVEDSTFSEDTAVKVTYSNGKEISFNGIEVLNISFAAAMTDEEWGTIQENLSSAYIAFQRDYPGVFWLGDSPKVMRICNEQTAENGAKVYNYTIYFVLKTHGKEYDIRKDTYQSAEAVWAAVAERDQNVQAVLAGLAESDVAKVVAYFNENLEALAKSMGGDADSPARAMKLLCDNVGVPCLLAYGAGGALESYVFINGTWYVSGEVKALEEEAKAEAEKKEETQAEEKKEETKAEGKSEKPATALPAVRSVEKAEVAPTMTRAASAEAKTAHLYLLQEDGQGGTVETLANDSQVIAAIVSPPREEDLVFGKTFGQILSSKIRDPGNILRAYVEENNTKEPVKDFKIVLSSGYSGVYPDAGPAEEYRLRYTGVYGADNNPVRGDISGTLAIKCKSLSVGTSGLMFDRVYKGTAASDFTPVTSPGITWQNAGGDNGVVEVKAVPDMDDVVEDDGSSGTSGSVGVRLEFSETTSTLRANANNYTLGDVDCDIQDRVSTKVLTNRIRWSSVPKTIYSGGLTINIDPTYPLVYTGNNLTPPVTVLDEDGDTLNINTDYVVTYTNNRDATVGTNTPANIHISPRGQKYTWDDNKEFNVSFQIQKAPKENIDLSEQVTKYGKNTQIDLNSYMETGATITKVDVVDMKYADGNDISIDNIKDIFSVVPRAANVTGGAVVEYTIVDNEALIGATANVLVTIGNAKNYENYRILFPIRVADKSEQSDFKFEQERMKITKGDDLELMLKAVEGSKVEVSSDDPCVDIKYEDSIVTLHADSAGRATITATASATEDYRRADAICVIEVVPKNNTVTYSFPFTSGSEEYKLEVEKGISRKYEDEDVGMTAGEIEGQLTEELLELKPTIPEENIAIYDVALFIKNADGKWEWEEVKDNPGEDEIGFPKGGVRITLPYPEESNINTDKYAAVHMFTTEANGKKPGRTESWDQDEEEIEKIADGLKFTVTGLSPIAVGWETDSTINPDDPNNPTNPDDPNNPANPDDPNNPTNPNNPNSNTTTNDPTTRAANGTTTGSGTGTATGSGSGTGSGTGTTTGGKVLSALTGDNAQILVYAVLFVLTGAVICGLFALKKKPNAKKK